MLISCITQRRVKENVKIEILVKKETLLSDKWQTHYMSIVKKNLTKYPLEEARTKIKEELKKVVPKYVRAGLQLGTNWVNNGEA